MLGEDLFVDVCGIQPRDYEFIADRIIVNFRKVIREMALGDANPERVKIPTATMYLDLRDYLSNEFDNDFPLRILRTANDEVVSSGLWQRRSIKFPRA